MQYTTSPIAAAIPENGNRKESLTSRYLHALDLHIEDLATGRCEAVLTLKEVAGQLFVHPRHLSNVVKEVTGFSTCYHFETKIANLARQLLHNPELTIKRVAMSLDYDPSNFTKFFKHYTGQTPSSFRKQHVIKY
jgi:AraC family transcriptional regulator of adaptative response / methylphosphotriester-DNA alkyltransferase methyltransferase